jgi:hypothetical protein
VSIDAANHVAINVWSSPPFSFTGTLDDSSITGTWKRNGASGSLVLTKPGADSAEAAPTAATIANAALIGDWAGAIQGPNLRLVVHIKKNGPNLAATCDSLDQGANGLASTVAVDATNHVTVTIDIPSPFVFKGVLSGKTIIGTWSQSGQTGALAMTKLGD